LAGIMGNLIILAVEAHEVAAHGGHGVRPGARQEMEQRLFFNGVEMCGNDSAIVEAVKDAVLVFPDVAEAPFPRFDPAFVGA
jgi:hypothetical protein